MEDWLHQPQTCLNVWHALLENTVVPPEAPRVLIVLWESTALAREILLAHHVQWANPICLNAIMYALIVHLVTLHQRLGTQMAQEKGLVQSVQWVNTPTEQRVQVPVLIVHMENNAAQLTVMAKIDVMPRLIAFKWRASTVTMECNAQIVQRANIHLPELGVVQAVQPVKYRHRGHHRVRIVWRASIPVVVVQVSVQIVQQANTMETPVPRRV